MKRESPDNKKSQFMKYFIIIYSLSESLPPLIKDYMEMQKCQASFFWFWVCWFAFKRLFGCGFSTDCLLRCRASQGGLLVPGVGGERGRRGGPVVVGGGGWGRLLNISIEGKASLLPQIIIFEKKVYALEFLYSYLCQNDENISLSVHS